MAFKLEPVAFTREDLTHFGPEFRIDRFHMWAGSTELRVPLGMLRAEARHVTRTRKVMRNNPLFQMKFEVHQPTAKCLEVVDRAIGYEIPLMINYLELACDIPVRSLRLARALQLEFLASAHVLHQRQEVKPHGNTFYYGRAFKRDWLTDRKVKQPRGFAVYADKPSKLASPIKGSPCLHIEWRLSGVDALRSVGISCLQDLINFDHRKFWNATVRMLQLPGMAEQGRLLAGRGRSVKDAALRKRARNAHATATVDGVLVMQHLVQQYPKLIRRLFRIEFTTWAADACARAARTDTDTPF